MKLKEIIDAAFNVRDAQRAPQAPSVPFKEREGEFKDQAAKIKILRTARLANVGGLLPTAFVFDVVRHRGHWRILHAGKHSAPFADQAAAILAAKKLARLKASEGRSVQVILRRMDGESVVQSIDTDECSSSN